MRTEETTNECPILTPACQKSEDTRFLENIPLVRRAQAGDPAATEELVKLNLGLVSGIARRYMGRGTDFEDLRQIGSIGLLKAIRSFDESRGCAFSTYAVPLIFGEIRRFLRDDGLVKVSRVQKHLGARLIAEREKALLNEGVELHIEELARRTGVSVEEATGALDAATPLSSLSELLYGEEGGVTLEARLADDEENERTFNKIAISTAIQKLPDMRKKIILLRYFRDLSQEETAARLGLSQVKISREEKKILALLREELS